MSKQSKFNEIFNRFNKQLVEESQQEQAGEKTSEPAQSTNSDAKKSQAKQQEADDAGVDGLDQKLKVGNWVLKCYQKAIPNTSDNNTQCDLYRPMDEELRQRLKKVLDIDYFALEYTTRKPTDLEIALKNPFNMNNMMSSANCKFMAFDQNHRPLTKFGSSNCFIERGSSKTEFNLVEGMFPVATKPEQSYSEKDFKETILPKFQVSKEFEEVKTFSGVDKIITGLYKLLKEKTEDNINYADYIIQQYISNNKELMTVFNKCLVAIMLNCLKNMIEGDELKYDEQKFKQALQSGDGAETYKKLLSTISNAIKKL